MKRLFLIISSLVLLLAGCVSPGNSTVSIMDVQGGEIKQLYENRDNSLPAAVEYIFQGVGSRIESPLWGEESVNAVLDAIGEICVTGETNISVTDNDSGWVFINADGSKAGGISFNGSGLSIGDKTYTVGGTEALEAIHFPAAGRNDLLFCDGPDGSLETLLEKAKDELPALVRVDSSTLGEYVITNKKTIEDLIDLLYTIYIDGANEGAENTGSMRDVVFVMKDDTEYKLSFEGENYIYDFPEPLGKWTYYTHGAEYFFELLDGAKSE